MMVETERNRARHMTKTKVLVMLGVMLLIVGLVLAIAMPSVVISLALSRACPANPELCRWREITFGGMIALGGLVMLVVGGVESWLSRLWRNDENSERR